MVSTVEPPNTAALGTGEKTTVLENSGKGSHIVILYNQEKRYAGLEKLKISGSIGGRRSTEGRY